MSPTTPPPKAIIRYGDYPRGENTLKITVILSQLSCVEDVRQYYDKMPGLMLEKRLGFLEKAIAWTVTFCLQRFFAGVKPARFGRKQRWL